MTRCIIATRGSALALWQANAVADAIRAACPDVNPEFCLFTTKGDKNLSVPLSLIGDKGLFVEELEEALADGRVDLCVHSVKDMPAKLREGCTLAACLPRASANDVLVLPEGGECTDVEAFLASGARVGTGSLRRSAQLRATYPTLNLVGIRGNVDTRIAKLDAGAYDGIVLAAAGIERLGLGHRISHRFSSSDLIPAIGQGAVGLEIRGDDAVRQQICEAVNDLATLMAVTAERLVLESLDGGCKVPMGAYARREDGVWVMDAFVALPDGSRLTRVHACAEAATIAGEPDAQLAAILAEDVLAQLDSRGAREVLTLAKAMVEGGEAHE